MIDPFYQAMTTLAYLVGVWTMWSFSEGRPPTVAAFGLTLGFTLGLILTNLVGWFLQ